MTELYIFGKIIWDWRGSLQQWQINKHDTAYRFLFAADIWVFLNLGLALIISVPYFNLYTHGTHTIVAHAMGSTIGINTMILLSSLFYLINEAKVSQLDTRETKKVINGFWITNVSLAVFLIALICAGLGKGIFYTDMPFQAMMFNIRPFLVTFTLAGVALMLGLWVVLWQAFNKLGILNGSIDVSKQDEMRVNKQPT
jgi:nitric oxide reductase subunit B